MGGAWLPAVPKRIFRQPFGVSPSLSPVLTSLLPYLASGADGKRVGRYNGLPIQKESLLMQYRRFGRTGWNVSEIGYGMWGLAGWTSSNDAALVDALKRTRHL